MAIQLRNGAIFLHVPKTGGKWVAEVLSRLDLIERKLGKKHDDTNHLDCLDYTFCFVRHPFNWYESWFKYQTALGWLEFGNADEWHPCRDLNGLGGLNFESFLSDVLTYRPGFVSRMYSGYQADFIGKQESLADDLIRVLGIMEIKFNPDDIRAIAPIGVSPETDLTCTLQSEILQTEQDALVRYGYVS